MSKVLDAIVPPHIGVPFRWLLASSWVSNIGDGFAVAAGPLLVASQTDEPFLVALAALLLWAPPLLFGLYAGVLTDRLDRRRIVVAVDLTRAAVLGVLVAFVATDTVTIGLVLVALFLLGTAEMFADNASSALLPMVVPRHDLALANARLQVGFVTVNQLAGPPLGAALFAVGMAWPFAAQAGLVLLGAALISRVASPAPTRDREARTAVRHDIAEGFRWVWHNAAVRTLVLTIFTFNITFGAAWSVLVLYATDRLGLGAVGFGLVTTVGAVGGLLGRHLLRLDHPAHLVGQPDAGRPDHRDLRAPRPGADHRAGRRPGDLLRLRRPCVHLGHHLDHRAAAGGSPELQGRVGSVNLVGVFGGLVIGSGLGGVLAQHWGLTAPFWFAFVGSAVFVVLIWGQLSHIAHADEAEAPASAELSE